MLRQRIVLVEVPNRLRPHKSEGAIRGLVRAVLVLLLITALAPEARAEVPNLALIWDAPVGCPSRTDVERSVDRLLGSRPPDDRRVDAHVVVTQRSSGLWMADLVISGSASGNRQLEGESCSAIALATAVVLAFAVDPRAAPAVPPEEPKEHAVPPPVEAPVPKATAEPILPYVHLFGGAALRALPVVAGEVGLGVGARRSRWEVELLGAYAPSQSVQVAGPPRAGADITLLSANALGCFAPIVTHATALDLCVGGALERMSAQANGVSNPGSGSVLLLSPMAAVRSRFRLVQLLSLVLDLAATVRQFHPRFVIAGVGQVYDIPIVGGSLAGGLQLEF